MFRADKPPRPRTKAAGLLMLVGAIVMMGGTGLPWISHEGADYNAYDEWAIFPYIEDTPVGPALGFFGVVLLGFGIATLAAGRLLPIMIIGIVVAALALSSTVVQLADFADIIDVTSASIGAGIVVSIVGAGAALAGAIAGCATRRRW
jgi:hypothetical protein